MCGWCAGGEVIQGCDVSTEYRCSNGNCIPRTSVNNSINDCGDNSDEGEANNLLIRTFLITSVRITMQTLSIVYYRYSVVCLSVGHYRELCLND